MVIDDALRRLAQLYGVTTEYADYIGVTKTVSATTVREVLAAMGLAAGSRADVDAAIAAAEGAAWQRLVPPSVVVRANGRTVVRLRVPASESAHATLRFERGGTHEALVSDCAETTEREFDGVRITERECELGELPLGYHELTVTAGHRCDTCILIVAPQSIPWPDMSQRADGWMLQLYAVRSRRSWGIGDLSDLKALVEWSGHELGMAAVLVNPMHAVAPVRPMQRSPYFPSSKRFANPIYLDPDAVAERATLDDDAALQYERFAAQARESGPDLIDRDTAWAAKRAALEILHAQPRADASAYATYRDREGPALEDFATFCALSERHGGDWRTWPEELHDPRSRAVGALADQLADRIEFHQWLQFLCDIQLGAAQRSARESGMAIGVVHDLAVGVDPGGADSWSIGAELATGVSVGAPPDLYAKHGQDWSQPPLRPDRLRETGYAPLRDMLRPVLRNAGGIRIDHILGLYRLWWIPPGRSAAEGTYVHYPMEEMLGVIALEASRAGAIVIGEDLGTVPPGFRETLYSSGILGSAILYFQRDGDVPTPPEQWPASSLATINTHDLVTSVGYLDNARVPLYRALGLLDDEQAAEALQQEGLERDQLVQLMVDRGLVAADADIEERVDGMHALLGASPCKLVLASLADAVYDARQPNVPGTQDHQHPNWCLPLATVVDGTSVPILLDDVLPFPGVRRVVAALRREGTAAGR